MKLHSSAFERRLRRGVKQAVRASVALKREYRRANKYRRHYSGGSLMRTVLSVGVAFAVWKCTKQTGHATTGLAVLALWTSWLALARASMLTTVLAGSADTSALALLPISDHEVFRWRLQKFLRTSLWSLADIAAAAVMLGISQSFSAGRYFVLPLFVLLVWVTQQSLAALCTVRLPRLSSLLMIGTFVVSISAFFADRWFQFDLLGILDRHAENLNLVLPTGWPISLFNLFTGDPRWWLVCFLLPVALVIYSLRDSLARLKASFSFNEMIQPEATDLPPDDFVATKEMLRDVSGPEEGERVLRVSLTEVEGIIQSRQFLKPHNYGAPQWLERWLWNYFSARERTLAEFSFPDGIQLTKPWLKVFRNLAVATLLALSLQRFNPGTATWILVGGVVVTGLRVLSLAFATGRAFQAVFCSGVNIPLYAVHPAGFREMSRMLFKCTFAQLLPIALFTASTGMLICQTSGVGFAAGLVYGIKAAILLPAARGFALALSFSSGTNDTSNVTLRSVLILGPMICGGMIFLGLSGAGLFVPDPAVAWGLTLAAIAAAYGFFRLYGWLYQTNRFDLMSVPQRR